jgi:hypothetical protein
MSGIMRGKDEPPRRFAALQELEKMLGKLTFTALKLSNGADRRDSLVSIDSFRERIAAMKRLGSRQRSN